jgi:hypothetical protein
MDYTFKAKIQTVVRGADLKPLIDEFVFKLRTKLDANVDAVVENEAGNEFGHWQVK